MIAVLVVTITVRKLMVKKKLLQRKDSKVW